MYSMQTMHYALYRLRIHVECLFAFVGTGEERGLQCKNIKWAQ